MARERAGRRGRRGGGGSERTVGAINQLPWREIVNPYRPFDILHDDQVERLHEASLTILESIGMEVLHAPTRDMLKREGADVAGELVKFSREMIEDKIALAPSEFTLHARNPAHNVTIGGNRMVVTGVGGPPYVSDLEGGRRIGNFEDMCNFTRVLQSLNIVHQDGGGAVEPQDLPGATRHLDMYRAMITLTDKTWSGYALGAERAEDAIEATRIALNCDRETLTAKPGTITIINTNSPLRFDIPMAEGMTAYVRCGQPVTITPFTLAGAMSPATIAGALAQQNAEALGVISIAQCIRPGTPVIYGGFTSNVDMKSGAPAFGTPEYAKAVLAGCQLARRYGIPYRTSNVNASNAVDAQAAYESEMSLWAAVTGQAHLLYQGAGWLEGGLVASFEKLILDAEMIQGMSEMLVPIEITDDTIGIEAMRDVGPGGHFFGTQHTLDRYETAFYNPILSDWRNYESWREAGAPDAATRAHGIWKQLLAEYVEPPLDPAVLEELDAFIARRKEEGGALD